MSDPISSKFARIPQNLIFSHLVGHASFRLWCILCMANFLGEHLDVEQLARIMETTDRSIYRWLRVLEDNGWIAWDRHNTHRPGWYMLHHGPVMTPETSLMLRLREILDSKTATVGQIRAILEEYRTPAAGQGDDQAPAGPDDDQAPGAAPPDDDQAPAGPDDDQAPGAAPSDGDQETFITWLVAQGMSVKKARQFGGWLDAGRLDELAARSDLERRLAECSSDDRMRRIGSVVRAWELRAPRNPKAKVGRGEPDPLPPEVQERMGWARAIAPSDAIEEEIEQIALSLSIGNDDQEALRFARAWRDYWYRGQ